MGPSRAYSHLCNPSLGRSGRQCSARFTRKSRSRLPHNVLSHCSDLCQQRMATHVLAFGVHKAASRIAGSAILHVFDRSSSKSD
ncbi:hypothetical protein BCR44DRAFT_1436076 [Catenaria anguillulae PL171]|uniref:Uncharacterized protein n=1 Tax=Catenaria anguillulae PL171 TaxID=765915 RepID=A0A1Y2HJ45_9FUNG|nr:hypothetical protein BCR44DRAFT_1436076 [Catenaria anguillulae PL171]